MTEQTTHGEQTDQAEKTYPDVTPYELAMLINAKLEEAGSDKTVQPQTLYSKVANGSIKSYRKRQPSGRDKIFIPGEAAARYMKNVLSGGAEGPVRRKAAELLKHFENLDDVPETVSDGSASGPASEDELVEAMKATITSHGGTVPDEASDEGVEGGDRDAE